MSTQEKAREEAEGRIKEAYGASPDRLSAALLYASGSLSNAWCEIIIRNWHITRCRRRIHNLEGHEAMGFSFETCPVNLCSEALTVLHSKPKREGES